MEFIKQNVGDEIDIENEFKNSKEAIIASAYFKPRPLSLKALKKIPDLKIIYSDEYQITDPEILWELVSCGAEIRFVPIGTPNGRFHAKVYYGIRKGGSEFAFIGSANLTNTGLFFNQEAGVLFDSKETETDEPTIEEVKDWLTEIWEEYKEYKFDESKYKDAKRQRQAYKEWLKSKPKDTDPDRWKGNTNKHYGRDWKNIQYFAVMPGKKAAGEDFHREFRKYQLVGIGYTATPNEGKRMVNKLQGLKKGDLILICRGYNTQSTKKVPIFSLARINDDATKDYRHDRAFLNSINTKDAKFKDWLKYWRDAKVIEPDEEILEKNKDLAKWLDQGSLEHAVQKLKPEGFERLAKELFEKYGLVINI